LFLAKFLTTIALHVNIFPEFASGMSIMKYVNNHPFNFDMDKLAFTLGFLQMVFAFVFELCNIIILFSRINVFLTIASFVTLDVLFRLQTMYLNNSIMLDRQNCLKDIMLDENAPKITMRDYKIRF